MQTGSNLSGYFHAQREDGERNYMFRIVDDELHFEEEEDDLKVAMT